MLRDTCCLLALLVLAVSAATAQDADALLGRWTGSDAGNKDVVLVFEKGFVTIGGQRMPCRLIAPGALAIGEPAEPVDFEVKDDHLVLRHGTETARFVRYEASQTKPAPADPFSRKFAGDNVVLELRGSLAEGYRGTLGLLGKTYPVVARGEGNRLVGKFEAPSGVFDFEATLADDLLTLTSGGGTFRLKGEATSRPVPTPIESVTAKDLAGVYTGETNRFEHPRGWFGFDMPPGWTVYQQTDTDMVVNPGQTSLETLEAIVGLLWGRLQPEDENRPVGPIIRKAVPALREALRQYGIVVGEPVGPIVTVKTKDVPGAVLEFRGTSQGRQVSVWCGGIVKRDGWILVSGVVAAGKETAYVPKVKRIFVSLVPRPPVRNKQLEAALVGRTFNSSQYGRVVSAAHHSSYGFVTGNVVNRRLMSNIISKPGLPGSSVDTTRSGRYEVCGDIVYMFFDDGQSVGHVLVEGGRVVGFRIGSARYR